jgi:hypothetical protein
MSASRRGIVRSGDVGLEARHRQNRRCDRRRFRRGGPPGSPDGGKQRVPFVRPHVVKPGGPAVLFALVAFALAPGHAEEAVIVQGDGRREMTRGEKQATEFLWCNASR